MKWEKKGVIFSPDGSLAWAKHSALQPTPIVRNDSIRIYLGLRDEGGVSRVGFIDVDPENPSRVLSYAKKPVLDIGVDGAFDENGVVPCCIVAREGKLFLYYAGYQLGYKVRFFVYAGLAISDDGGESFCRVQDTPVLDRTSGEMLFRVAHSALPFRKGWRIWYGAGSGFVQGAAKTLPVYDIRYIDSRDGIHFVRPGTVCIPVKGGDEHRLGRPYVIKEGRKFSMFYSIGTQSKGYRLGYAESRDATIWTRKDDLVGIDVSPTGWDSQMIAYPSVVKWDAETYMFYNGNDYGRTGVGYAVLVG